MVPAPRGMVPEYMPRANADRSLSHEPIKMVDDTSEHEHAATNFNVEGVEKPAGRF